MKALRRGFAVVAVLLLLAVPALAQKYAPAVQKAIDAVRKQMDAVENGKGGEIKPQQDDVVLKALPDHKMVIVRFRVFPVARIMPKGMKASNLFAVDKEGKVEHLKDVKGLEKFLNAHAAAAKNEKDARTALAAWLTLTEEFHQDGFFKFEVLEKEFTYADGKASGRVMVTGGGNGDLKVDLAFDKDGKLAKVEEKAAIRPGPRPICQATKLLDADPIVRQIAEQDLIIMGLPAHAYLMEQRDRAAPELRQAIDRLWERIQRNGW
jgi:hypothetical protein